VSLKRILTWGEAEFVASGLFGVWTEKRDYHWIERNWSKFSWGYSDNLELEDLKIKLITLSHVYGEFCYCAYDQSYELPVYDIIEVFGQSVLSFSPLRIGQLVGERFDRHLEIGTERTDIDLLAEAVTELVLKKKYHVIEELISVYKGVDELYEELVAIVPNVKADYRGYEYIASWGDICG
jgi:hypothetical protein